MEASDQAALKALTARANVKETSDGEPFESRSTKNMKDSAGSALAISVSEETPQVISLLLFPGGHCVAGNVLRYHLGHL